MDEAILDKDRDGKEFESGALEGPVVDQSSEIVIFATVRRSMSTSSRRCRYSQRCPKIGISQLFSDGFLRMNDIYLLIEHGIDQGEVYVLGWFEDKKIADEVAEEKEWEAYRASLKAEHTWSNPEPVSPADTTYRRFWIQQVSKIGRIPTAKSLRVH
jgi:hypothetical protein